MQDKKVIDYEEVNNLQRTPSKKKAKELAKYLRSERPDYYYLKNVFRYLRDELEIKIPEKDKKLPRVPKDEELKTYYEAVWNSQKFQDMLIIKTFCYTGARVSELINIKIVDVDLAQCQIRINEGKGEKDRVVPFPATFKELLGLHIKAMKEKKAVYLFESSWDKKYTDRGIRKMLAKYSKKAKLPYILHPHALRHYLFTWLKREGIDDAFIQPYSGHESRKSLEIYSKLSITDAQEKYNEVINKYPI